MYDSIATKVVLPLEQVVEIARIRLSKPKPTVRPLPGFLQCPHRLPRWGSMYDCKPRDLRRPRGVNSRIEICYSLGTVVMVYDVLLKRNLLVLLRGDVGHLEL